MASLLRSKWLTLFWMLLMSYLFFMPQSSLPKESWLDGIYFDKWVHIGLFAVLTFLARNSLHWNPRYINGILLLLAFVYGLSVEFIQKYFTVDRSFDLVDVAADMMGSLLGLFAWFWIYRKK